MPSVPNVSSQMPVPRSDSGTSQETLLIFDKLHFLDLSALLSATDAELSSVSRAVPNKYASHLPRSSSPTRNEILSSLLYIREELLSQIPQGQLPLEKLLAMSPQELKNLSETDLPSLLSLMRASLQYEPNLTPKLSNTSNALEVVCTALMWKASVLDAALVRSTPAHHIAVPLQSQEAPAQSRNGNAVRPEKVTDDPPPPPVPNPALFGLSLSSPNDEDGSPAKRQKLAVIGGVPVKDTISGVDENFRTSLGGVRLISPSALGEYPGRANSSKLLRVSEIVGPSILLNLVQQGVNVELAVPSRAWRRGARGGILAPEAEAVSLARCIHLNLLSYPTMTQAVMSCEWMEVALRRLFALLYVENQVQRNNVSRAAAWSIAESILEAHPANHIRVPPLEAFLARQTAAHVKQLSALQSLGKQQAPKAPRQPPKKA